MRKIYGSFTRDEESRRGDILRIKRDGVWGDRKNRNREREMVIKRI